ncbi:MAG: hypothetical protein NTZ27_09180 [Ignavibacteriales bacterium]|nr:hypothetical protein [Ignavibacteriales bacterium]
MKFRYYFEAIVGTFCFIAILIFGAVGGASLSFLAFLPVITWKKKVIPDERELQLFYKTGNLTYGLQFVALTIIYFITDKTVNGHLILDSWLTLSISSITMVHGIAGLIFLKKG